jgi:hypothetical protein
MRQKLRLKDIVVDAGTQARVYDPLEEVIAEYAERSQAGDDLPPLEVVSDGHTNWLWDGFHRFLAYERLGKRAADCNVTEGTLEDARWLCCSANKKNALKRTTEDKQKAVDLALRLRPDLTDRAIADHCGVDHKTVGKHREALVSGGEIPHLKERTGRDGRSHPADRQPASADEAFDAAGGPDDAPAPTTPAPAPSANVHHVDEGGEAVAAAWADVPVSPEVPNTPGNARAAREAMAPPSREAAPKARPKRRPAGPGPADALGTPLPPSLRDVFADDALPGAVAEVRGVVERLRPASILQRLGARAKALPYLRLSQAVQRLEEGADMIAAALQDLEAGVPHAVCPACAGQGCDACRSCGYVTSWRLEELKREGMA